MFKSFFRKIRDTAKKIAPIAAPIAGIMTGNPYIGAGIGGLLGQYGGKEGAIQGAMLGGLGGLGARALEGNQLFSLTNTPRVAANVVQPLVETVSTGNPITDSSIKAFQQLTQSGGGGESRGIIDTLKKVGGSLYDSDKNELTGLGKLGASLAPALATYFALKADQPENPDANEYRSPVDEYYAARARGENPNPADYGLAPTPEERLVGDLEQRNFNMGGLASMQSEALPMSDVMNIRQQSIMKKNPMNNLMGVANLAMGGDPMFPRRTGEIDGPGGPKDDKIPAMLSDGEFVFTAKAVENAGGPSAMYKMMNSLDPESEKPSERM